jgi:hypothetical protein
MPPNRSLPAGAALAVELLSAYLSNNKVAAQDVPDLIRSVRTALAGEKAAALRETKNATVGPATSARKSLTSPALARKSKSEGAADVRPSGVMLIPIEAGSSTGIDAFSSADANASEPTTMTASVPTRQSSEQSATRTRDTVSALANVRTKPSRGPRRHVAAEAYSLASDVLAPQAAPASGSTFDHTSQPDDTLMGAFVEKAQMAPAPERSIGGDEQDSAVHRGSSPRLTLMEAITRQRTVTALYNGAVIKLAPHQIFERRGDLFLTALNLSKNWRADEERRLGQFKFAGLKDVQLLDEAIAPLPSYDGMPPRPDDIPILSI